MTTKAPITHEQFKADLDIVARYQQLAATSPLAAAAFYHHHQAEIDRANTTAGKLDTLDTLFPPDDKGGA